MKFQEIIELFSVFHSFHLDDTLLHCAYLWYSSTAWKITLTQSDLIKISPVSHDLMCVCVCVCVCSCTCLCELLCNFITCVYSYNHHHGQDIEQFCYNKDPTGHPFIVISTSTCPFISTHWKLLVICLH